MKKTWIKIKRGFLQPEHRTKMGIRVWLYMFMVDQADWETGIIYDWTDQNAADELGMPIGTLRQQRQELETARYIDCVQCGNRQTITILKWIDPRSYSGEVLNSQYPYEDEGTNKGTNKGENKGTNKGLKKSVPLHCTHISLTSSQEPEHAIRPIQRMIESVVHLPPSGVNDIMAMDEIEKMNPIQEDIQSAYDFIVGQGKQVRYYSSLVGCVRTAIAKRVQSKPKKLIGKTADGEEIYD